MEDSSNLRRHSIFCRGALGVQSASEVGLSSGSDTLIKFQYTEVIACNSKVNIFVAWYRVATTLNLAWDNKDKYHTSLLLSWIPKGLRRSQRSVGGSKRDRVGYNLVLPLANSQVNHCRWIFHCDPKQIFNSILFNGCISSLPIATSTTWRRLDPAFP